MVMSTTKKRQLLTLQLLALLIVTAISCNKKTEEETEIVVTPAIVAVKNFKLERNDSVLSKLDSVAFSVDLNTGVIFNADSLPKGTKVSKLVPVITFANTMTQADLTFNKENRVDTTVNYLTNSTDTIDFTYPVRLDVTAQDGTSKFTYTIKVNVHTQEPDSLMWQKLATSTLPSLYENPVAQKTVYRNETAYSLIEEYNGQYTLSNCRDLNEGNWQKDILDLGVTPNVASFTASDNNFSMLTTNQELLISEDGLTWTATGENWVSIIGAYGNYILGIKDKEGTYYHSQYPAEEGYVETAVESGFPIFNSSVLGVIDTEWAAKPIAILACGLTEDNVLSAEVWAYDGNQWAVINEGVLPALESPMMARYVVYRSTMQLFTEREFDVWLLFGGKDESGAVNRNLYMSYDNGVHWVLASDLMQLPETMEIHAGSDVIVAGYDLTVDLSEAWTAKENTKATPWTRTSYTIDGYDITWVCPYLYMFGGYLPDNTLCTEIWRGVIARLEFTPII